MEADQSMISDTEEALEIGPSAEQDGMYLFDSSNFNKRALCK